MPITAFSRKGERDIMPKNLSLSRKIFFSLDYAFLIILAVLCLVPMIHVLALSFSTSNAAAAGYVKLWPVNFTLKSYDFVSSKPQFLMALVVSLKRIAIGIPINMLLTALIAYPLSMELSKFRARKIFAWFFVITILFSGGLIPWYITIYRLDLINSIWALVLPGAVPVFNVIILLNFFKGLPDEIADAAFIDGAGHWRILLDIYVPLSVPAIATLTLFCIVGHWNSWFDGLILMNNPKNYPLQSYLQTVVVAHDFSTLSTKDMAQFAQVSDKTSKAAQIFLGALPILIVYPFLQRYFITGIVLGSVKG
jgi:putative aldouronate transport system permease protein